MPTPAAGSELRTAVTTDAQVTLSPVPSERSSPSLFNATGLARQLRASPLFAIGPAAPGPALRRGALIAVPIGLSLVVELGFDSPTKGAIATGALLAGFPGLDAPARPRAAWQAAAAPRSGSRRARRPQQPVGAARGPGDGPARRRRRLLLLGLAAPGDRRPLGLAGDGDRPGPLPGARRRLAGAALRHRGRSAPGGSGRCSSGSSPTAPPGGRGERLEHPGRDRGAEVEPDPALEQRPPRDPLRRRARRRRRPLPHPRDARPRLLDPADDPLRDAPRTRRDLPPAGPAGARHRARPRRRHRRRRGASATTW